MKNKIESTHLARRALVYVRQSTALQVHEHVESRQRQYALAERAVALGWRRKEIEVIDEDQGKSGADGQRSGFGRLADEVARGHVGAILAIEVSRLARSSLDWQRLLSLCAVAGVVVVDEQSVYDPADRDDRLLLDLKGTMSEAELHWLRLRLAGGRLNKARRGELRMPAPIGYVWGDGGYELDPDEAVCNAVRVVFERFAVEPSAWAVVRWARQSGLKFPARHHESGEVEWRTLTRGRLGTLLHNPTYAGVYAYGRLSTGQVRIDGEIRTRHVRRTPEDWVVRRENAHPAYISWETFMSNQARLCNNRGTLDGIVPGAPKNGRALLSGLALCGRCGRRMRVDYIGTGRSRWRYLCIGERDRGSGSCWAVSGADIDGVVEEAFLSAMVPDELDLSIAVEREAAGQAQSLQAQWQSRLEQASYDARRAERRYKAVDPDNRVVARTLEREWEERLRDLAEVERQYEAARRERRVNLSDSEREGIRALARDLPAVWRADTTEEAERKAMLRLVIETVALEPIDLPRPAVRVRVQWRSGAVDERMVERIASGGTPDAIVTRVRELAEKGLHDEQVAEQLNAEGLRTASLQSWTADSVTHVRRKAKIKRIAEDRPRGRALPERHPETGHFSISGAARRFGVPYETVRHWVRQGHVISHRRAFGNRDALWLDINDQVAATLAQLAKVARKRA